MIFDILMPQHTIVLVIILPLLTGLLSFALDSKKASCILTVIAASLNISMSYSLFHNVVYISKQVISYKMGGWDVNLGIEMSAGPIGSVMVLMIQIAYLASASLAFFSNANLPALYTLLSLFVAGLTGITLSNDAFNIFVFLEVAAISGYTMVSMGRGIKASLAAFDYLIAGAIGASFYLLGVGVLYLDTGKLNINMISLSTKHLEMATLASFFVIIGLSIKAAIFPLHLWLVRAYQRAPSCFAVLSGAVFTKVIVLIIVKMFIVLGWHEHLFFKPQTIAIFIGSMSMFFGAASACLQKSWRGIIANSSISQVGYIIVGLAMSSFQSVESALITIVAHTMIQISLFAIAGNDDDLPKQPVLSLVCVAILLCSIVGIPGTAGFISKWFILETLMDHKMWLVFGCVLFSSALAVVYCLKLMEMILFSESSSTITPTVNNSVAALTTAILLFSGTAILAIGIYPKPMAYIARAALMSMR